MDYWTLLFCRRKDRAGLDNPPVHQPGPFFLQQAKKMDEIQNAAEPFARYLLAKPHLKWHQVVEGLDHSSTIVRGESYD